VSAKDNKLKGEVIAVKTVNPDAYRPTRYISIYMYVFLKSYNTQF